MILKQLIIIFYCGIFQGQELLDKVCGWIFLRQQNYKLNVKAVLIKQGSYVHFSVKFDIFWQKTETQEWYTKILEFASDKIWDYFCIICVVLRELKNPAPNCYQTEDCRSENTK